MFFDCKYRLKSDDELSLNEKKTVWISRKFVITFIIENFLAQRVNLIVPSKKKMLIRN